ncbi:hypothetical protein MMC28_003286 [Mycoblastus sanguinarius]|nr:hypothetical protein [Mycoblastus sanguinarius]
MCAYTSLDPASIITPKTTASPPTNIPGQGGVPGCAAMVWGPAHLDCPYASGINYCDCGGTFAAPLPTTGSFINCDYTTQPASNQCPVNTAYSQSLASASSSSSAAAASSLSVASVSSASVASVSSVSASAAAAVFNPTATTTSCGATYGNSAGHTPAPRADVDIIEQGIADFCTPPDGTLTVIAGEPANINYALPNTDIIYQIALEWDPRPECSSHPAPSIVPSVPTGPDYWCNQYLLDLLNGCDTGDGQDKNGGRLFTDCAIYEWTPFIPPSGFNEPVVPWNGNGKRDLQPTKVQRPKEVRRGRFARNFVA